MNSLLETFSKYEWKTVLLFVASLVLSAASFFTTYDGMNELMGVWPVSAAITFSLQSLLFVVSWWLARNWYVGVSEAMFGIFIFLLCASISIFFSFSSLFDTIDGGRTGSETFGETRGALSDSLNEISKKQQTAFNADFDAMTSEGSAETPTSFGQWSGALEQFLIYAKGVPERSRSEREAAAAELRTKLDQLNGELNRYLNELETLTAQNERALSKVNQKQSEVDGVSKQISDLDSELADIEIQIETAAKRMEEEQKSGEGPNYRAARAALATAENDKVETEFQKTKLQERLAILEDELFSLQTEAGSAAALRSIEEKQKLINDAETQIGNIQAQRDALSTESTQELTANVTAVTDLLRNFKVSRDLNAYEKIVQECDAVLTAIRAIEASPELPSGFNCTRAEISSEVSRLQGIKTKIDRYETDCIASEPLTRDGIQYQEMIDVASGCLTASTLPTNELGDYRTEVRQLSRLGGLNVHAFTTAIKALQLGTDLAYLALFIAIAIDLLVLLCAFIGVSQMVPGTKDINRFLSLAHLEPDPELHSPDITEVVEAPTLRSEKGSFKRVAAWLTFQDYAKWSGTDQSALLLRGNARDALKMVTGSPAGPQVEDEGSAAAAQAKRVADRRRASEPVAVVHKNR